MTNSTLIDRAMLRWLSLVLICAVCIGAEATTYYVDATSGIDTNNGTSTSTAWKTIAKVNGYSNKGSTSATPRLNAGDSVLFKKGEIWREKLYIQYISGTSDTSRITFGAYGTGNKPVICASNAVTGWTQTSTNVWQATVGWTNPTALDQYDNSYAAPELVLINGSRGTKETALANLDIAGEWFWSATPSPGLLYVNSTLAPTDVELAARTRCIHGMWHGGANFIAIQDLELKNGLSHNLTISELNTNWLVSGVTAHHCGRLDPATNNAIDKNSFSVSSSNNLLITQCTVYESGGNNINVLDSSNAIVEKCVSYNAHHHCIDIKGGPSSPVGNIVRYNSVYYSSSFVDTIKPNGIVIITDTSWPNLTNTSVYGNIVYDVPANGIQVDGTTTVGTQIYNNTVINSKQYNFYLNNSTCSTTLKNNVGITNSVPTWSPVLKMVSATNKTIDYNSWLHAPAGSDVIQIGATAYQTVAAYSTASGLDTHSVSADPLFVNTALRDFHLQAASPCKDKGTSIAGYALDFDGKTAPQGAAVDLGALEIAQAGDTTKPVITLLGTTPVVVQIAGSYTDAGATATDNVDGDITAKIVKSGTVNAAAVGAYTITYNVSDTAANAAVPVVRTVNVVDTVKPVITLLGTTPVVVQIGGTYTDAGATATDNADGAITAKIVTSGTVNAAAIGSYTITYNVSDTAGNAAAPVARTVNVVDNVAPVITVLGTTPVVVQVAGTYTDAGATAIDNVDGTITAKIVKSGTVNTAAVGTYTITYTVSDTAGNAAAPVARTVNVVDTVKPVITLVGTTPVVVQVAGTYTDAGATAPDNVDGTITTKIVKSGTVNTAAVGAYTITYNVSDTAGNAAVPVTRTVNVADTVKPVITLVGTTPVVVQVAGTYTDAGATATDNVDGTITTKIVKSGTVNTAAVGAYTITYNVSDTAGNAAVPVTRTVNVADTVKPVITLVGTTPVVVQVAGTYTDAGATATDNVDGDITAKIVKSGTVNAAAVGTYTVTYNVSDTVGNAAAPVTRTVNVVDTVKPVITLVGTTPVVVQVAGTYTDAGATATDNVDGAITAKIVKSGTVNTAAVGTYTVTYNVSDTAGNAAAPVTRTVNVGGGDTVKPVITLLGSPTAIIAVGTAYTDAGATASDNVDGDITSKIVKTGTVTTTTAGTYTLTYNVTDAAANAATQVTRTVTVASKPVITPKGTL